MVNCFFKDSKSFLKVSLYLQGCVTCHLTARQYGEVVLPDASTGQSPGTLAEKAVTSLTLTKLKASVMGCKEGMARVFAVMVQIKLSITRVAVQV
jgi:hypothetical protein